MRQRVPPRREFASAPGRWSGQRERQWQWQRRRCSCRDKRRGGAIECLYITVPGGSAKLFACLCLVYLAFALISILGLLHIVLGFGLDFCRDKSEYASCFAHC